MGIFSKQPAATELKAFQAAEQRLQAVADKLGQVQRDLAQARARLAALRPGDTLEDLEAAATAFAAEHGRLQARVVFLQHARERLSQELAEARRAVIAAENSVAEALKQHFRVAADDRLRKLAGIVGEEVAPLACELARASGSAHTVITWDILLTALRDAVVSTGKASASFGVGLTYAEAQTAKIPPAPRSALLDGDHRAGRGLDRLNPMVDEQALRANLASLSGYIEEHRNRLLIFARDPDQSAKARELQAMIDAAEASRAELLGQLEQHEQHERLAA